MLGPWAFFLQYFMSFRILPSSRWGREERELVAFIFVVF